MFDVTAIGELLIDMAQLGVSDIGSSIFEANPGGAPCNVLAMLNKLGRSTAFIGKVGDDIFGKKLKNIVESSGTDVGGLVFDERVSAQRSLLLRRTNTATETFLFTALPVRI